MASLLQRFRNIPTHMDFDGQRKAERIFQGIILYFATVGLVLGYMFQQFSYTVYSLGIGFIISCLLTLPPWPMYRRKPLQWQKPRDEIQEASKSKKKK